MNKFIKTILSATALTTLISISFKSDAAQDYQLDIVEIQQCLPSYPETKCIELNNNIKQKVIDYYKKLDINLNWKTEKLFIDKELNINYNNINYDADAWKLKKSLIDKLGNKIQNKVVILNTTLDNEDEKTKEVLGVAYTNIDLILIKNQIVEKVNINYSAYVIKHEIGHILKLPHVVKEECNLMEPYIANNYYRCDDLDEDQINLMKESIKSRNVSN